VAQVAGVRLGSYITVTGNIVAHKRQNYFTFQDGMGGVRIGIENSVWQNRKAGPENKVRLLTEVDRGPGGRHLWVKSLQVIE
jgi:uncharacterized protein (TIGR00156 family)